MKLSLVSLLSILVLWGCGTKEVEITRQNPVSFTAVHINDQFWAPKIEANRKVSIPSAFHQCEINGRLDNFALAGGLISGEHQGDFPFDDTDVYKVIEGAAYALAVEYDGELDAYLDSVIGLIGSGQESDGYLYTCITNECERLRPWYGKGKWYRLNSHELYNCGHLYEAAVAHYEATGKRSLLDIAIKNADLVDEIFGPEEGKKKVPSGHPIIEMALVKLWRVTGEDRYLNLAKFFIDETGKATDVHKLNAYSQDHMPIVDQEEAVGHAVRLGYLYSGVTDVASLLNDSALMAASVNVWDNVVSKKLYLTGGIGSRAQGEGFGSNYELNNMTSYCETCASISNVYWNYRLFLNQPSSEFYDVLERTLYNGLISGVSLSGDKFFYDNPLESNHQHDRAPWFGCACCPGNVTRFMASVPGYVYTADDKNIMVNLFVGNEAAIPFGTNKVSLKQTTNYPWDGDISIEVTGDVKDAFNLLVRIPGWLQGEVVPSDLYHFIDHQSSANTVTVNGKKVRPSVQNGYMVFARNWSKGDVLEISFPMDVQKVKAIDNVQADKGKIAYQRGPVVYCFEDKDNNNGWLFDTYISPEAEVETQFEDTLLGGVETFSISGIQVKPEGTEEVALKAIPYYAWNNRGTSNMAVWMAEAAEFVYAKPEKLAYLDATATGSFDWAIGLNDGFDPYSSNNIDKPFYTWWHKNEEKNWVQYEFGDKITLSECEVYWLNIDHYEADYRAPESWYLEYKDASGKWKKVATDDPYETTYDVYNKVHFTPVTTQAVRLNATFQENYSAGILEWKVK